MTVDNIVFVDNADASQPDLPELTYQHCGNSVVASLQEYLLPLLPHHGVLPAKAVAGVTSRTGI